jgi:uncharacterized protein YggE
MKIAVISSAILLSVAAFGQNESNSITVTASRSMDVPIEQVSYSIQVKSAIDATLSQVLQQVQSLGITANDLSGVSTTAPVLQLPIPGISVVPDTPQLIWSFSFTSRFSQFQQTLSQLRAASTPNPDRKNFTISFSIVNASATQATIDEAASRVLPDLIADARVRAKRLVDAAGLTVGVILTLSDSRSTDSAGAIGVASADILRLATTSLGGFTSPKLTVSVSVRFAFLRYT